MPGWVMKLAQRLLALEQGQRYQIILTVSGRPDWTVTKLGKVES